MDHKAGPLGQHFYKAGKGGPKSNEKEKGAGFSLGPFILFKDQLIYGCEGNGNKDIAYLRRFTLIQRKAGGQLMLHWFFTSDHARELHNHPWDFWVLILWRGYNEKTEAGVERIWPLSLRFCKASHAHRVELLDGKPALTLVLTGPRKSAWGFFLKEGWLYWRDYFKLRKC